MWSSKQQNHSSPGSGDARRRAQLLRLLARFQLFLFVSLTRVLRSPPHSLTYSNVCYCCAAPRVCFFGSKIGLGALALNTNIFSFSFYIFNFLATVPTPFVASARARGDADLASRYVCTVRKGILLLFRTAFFCVFLCGLAAPLSLSLSRFLSVFSALIRDVGDACWSSFIPVCYFCYVRAVLPVVYSIGAGGRERECLSRTPGTGEQQESMRTKPQRKLKGAQ